MGWIIEEGRDGNEDARFDVFAVLDEMGVAEGDVQVLAIPICSCFLFVGRLGWWRGLLLEDWVDWHPRRHGRLGPVMHADGQDGRASVMYDTPPILRKDAEVLISDECTCKRQS